MCANENRWNSSLETNSVRPEMALGERIARATGLGGESETLRKGSELISERSEHGTMYLVAEGLLKATKCDELGRAVVVQLAEPGDVIGLELLLGLPMGATWSAIVNSKLRPLSATAAKDRISTDPSLALELSQVLMKRLARAQDKVRDFAHKSARSRASGVLLSRARTRASGEIVIRNLTRQDLAAMAGMTPETFIRILSSFREKGIVSTQGRLITIQDRDRLANIAGVPSARNGNGHREIGTRPPFEQSGWTQPPTPTRNAVC